MGICVQVGNEAGKANFICYYCRALPAAAVFLALRPAAQLAGWTKPELGSPPPKVEPDRVIPRRNYRSPLGLLILDRSGSMVKLDPKFFQSVAAEAFAFFFTRLIGDEVHPDDYDKMHFAVVLYPGMEQDGPGTRMLSDTGEMEGADAVIWGQNGGLWLQVARSAQTWKSDASESSRIVEEHLRSILGEPGAYKRRGTRYPLPAGRLSCGKSHHGLPPKFFARVPRICRVHDRCRVQRRT